MILVKFYFFHLHNKENDKNTTMYGDESEDHKSEPDKDAELLTWLYRVTVKICANFEEYSRI